MGDIRKKLGNERQKQEFDLETAHDRVAFNGVIQDHVANEITNYDKQETFADLANSKMKAFDAAGIPAAVGFQADYQAIQLRQYAQRNGIGDDELKKQIAEHQSATYAGAVKILANQGQDADAKTYFDSIKENILPDDRTVAEDAVKTAYIKGESQRTTAHLALEHDSYSEAKSALDTMDIADPDVKEATQKRLKSFYQEKAQNQEMVQDANFESAYKILKSNGGNLDGVDILQLNAMDSRHREGIERTAEAIKLSKFPDNGSDTYFNFMRLASDPSLHDEFIKENVDLHRADMSPSNFNRLKELDLEIRARKDGVGTKPSKAFDGLTSKSAVLDSTLRSMGLDPKRKIGSEKEDPRVRAIQQQFDRAIEAESGLDQKELTTPDVQKIADRMLEEVAVTRSRSLLGQSIYNLTHLNFSGDNATDYQEKVRKGSLPNADKFAYSVGQVPAADRELIMSKYQKRGATPSADDIINAYNAGLGK